MTAEPSPYPEPLLEQNFLYSLRGRDMVSGAVGEEIEVTVRDHDLVPPDNRGKNYHCFVKYAHEHPVYGTALHCVSYDIPPLVVAEEIHYGFYLWLIESIQRLEYANA